MKINQTYLSIFALILAVYFFIIQPITEKMP